MPKYAVRKRSIRIPARLRTAAQLLDALLVERNLAEDWQKIQQDEAHELALLKKREHRIKQKYAKRRQRIETRRNTVASKTFEFATENRAAITRKGNENTATLSTGTRLLWRSRKVSNLPENDRLPEDKARLESFYEEMAKRGLEAKYVRIKKEPNRSALNDTSNEAEVATFETVSLRKRTRFTIELGRSELNISGIIGTDGRVHSWEYVEPRTRT